MTVFVCFGCRPRLPDTNKPNVAFFSVFIYIKSIGPDEQTNEIEWPVPTTDAAADKVIFYSR